MADEFDVVVIGGGPAGEHAAGKAAGAGLEAVLVESELVGGECSYWACMPSKTLIRPSQVLATARTVPGAKEALAGSIDVESALARRNWMVADWEDSGQVEWLAGVGAQLVRGHGRIVGERLVEVTTPDGTLRQIAARRAVIIATGSSAVIPPIDGLRESRHWDNRGITAAKSVPNRLHVLGGGVVGVEMAQGWRRLGANEVTIFERAERLVPEAEPFVADELIRAFEKEGITVLTGRSVTSVRRAGPDAPVHTTVDDGRTFVADEILVATGRRPRTDDLGLEFLGLDPRKPIATDAQLRVSGVEGGWLYAVGDVNGKALLTHMGKYQARVAVRTILGEHMSDDSDVDAISSVTFTDPQVASVGLTEKNARAKGLTVRTVQVKSDTVAAAAIWGEEVVGTSQLVIDTETSTIVGATFVGPEIGELLHSATIAIVTKATIEQLRHAVPAFPTFSELWLELVESYFS